MGFFNRKKQNPLHVDIAAPDTVHEDSLFLDIAVTLQSESTVQKPLVSARLRADITEKRKARGAAEYYLLGETQYGGQVSVIAGEPTRLEIRIPLDFTPMALFDIPTANIAMASPEMQAAMSESQEIGQLYTYSVEVVTKIDDQEYATRSPIEFIRPDSTRVASFT